MNCNYGDLYDRTEKARRPTAKDIRRDIRFLRDCGHHSVSMTCRLVLKSVKSSRNIFDTRSVYYRLCTRREMRSLEKERCATLSIYSLFDKQELIAVQENWFKTYNTERICRVHDCYFVVVTDNYSRKGLL